ncbi:MAG: DNA damage-inducible protein D [Bacteroidales bacterium]|nr:DNA damage-inducible protein D [Bacteroidales bacterium]
MKQDEIKQLLTQFEAIACNYEGVECWSARDLQKLLDYAEWRNFCKNIEKAKEACKNANIDVLEHFVDVNKVFQVGNGAEMTVNDILLTRYACYLIAQNGDPRKPQIAFAQSYFAVQTRFAEAIEQRLLEYERVTARKKLQETEKKLSGILYERGIDDKGFAIIRSKGDTALFRLNTEQLKKEMNVPKGRPLADFLPTVTIKAKDFAAAMTSENVNVKNLSGEDSIAQEHVENNSSVRRIMIERGLVPENLPPAEDVKKVERRLHSERKKLNGLPNA